MPASAAFAVACAALRAPTMAEVTSGRRSTQATASSATPERPHSRARASSSCTACTRVAKLPSVKSSLCARQSLAAKVWPASIFPVSSPCASGP